MQAREAPAQDRKARTGKLGRSLEIEQAERLAQIEVLLWLEVEGGFLPLDADA